ncbi:MAG: UDP-N-acetylmuramate--L-alanine ligase [Calditrichaeota bacterium]|nr:UDP-N-acetylmuramate--L-alanine ligase [Calditrichota bacterium]RQV99711.1 MAG: UDP-N-acetylmuramate--L-alanine ligase [Calditrichota bacterium]
MKIRLGKIKNIHFVGIGGIGMSGIAEVLVNLGYKVSGSDKSLSDVTEYLEKRGVRISDKHVPENVKDADVLVYSSAVTTDNPEVQEAYRRKIPVIKRAEMLAELMRLKFGIAIAGTHGKTTTTSLTGAVLSEGELDPTLIIGGKVRALGTNAKLGDSEFLVAEADEYDKSFLRLIPTIAVITNIEADHLESYDSLDDLKNSFISFANKVPFYGRVIICLDNPGVQEILTRIERSITTYGFNKQADIQAYNVEHKNGGIAFDINYMKYKLGRIELKIPGEHNVLNTLAAIAVGLELDIPFEKIKSGLEKFSGVKRRFEHKAVINDVMVVDDYAHHPSEILATLQAARRGWPQRRLLALFQPHLYSRTRDFYMDFARSFLQVDVLIGTDVYPAREKPMEGVSGKLITDTAASLGHKEVHYVADKTEIPEYVADLVRAGDMVITLGAGDIWKFGEALIEVMKSRIQNKRKKPVGGSGSREK